jgi:5-hydroxyisourate hydrolase
VSTVSTHVLDTAAGRPAAGVGVTLERLDAAGLAPVSLGRGVTDADGRLRDLLAAGAPLAAGTYRLRFDVGAYFARAGRDTFYPEVIVCFHVGAREEHYHVPLLLSPFGYSTYRGS